MFDKTRKFFSGLWEDIKSFFKHSTVIFWARAQAIAGILLAAAGTVDWTAVASLDWKNMTTATWVAVAMIANGVLTEVLRRRSMNVAS